VGSQSLTAWVQPIKQSRLLQLGQNAPQLGKTNVTVKQNVHSPCAFEESTSKSISSSFITQLFDTFYLLVTDSHCEYDLPRIADFQSRIRYTFNIHSDLLGFGTFCIIQYSKKLENTLFHKLDLLLSSGEEGDTYYLGSLRKN
jgi:hypothetical protein